MRHRGIPKEYTEWISQKVEGRKTILSFDDFNTEERILRRGMDQGCPLSGIAYQFYNADLLETTNKLNREDSVAFVDDTAIFTEGKYLSEAFSKLEDIMERRGGALDWAKSHKCEFALNKFGLVGFTRKRETASGTQGKKTRPVTRPHITIGGHKIEATDMHKYLGVIMDQELRYKEHTEYAAWEGEMIMNQYKRLANTKKGIIARHMRQFYLAVVAPKMLYAADIFLVPETDRSKGTKGPIAKLAKIQRQAAIAITGALRTM